MIQLPFNLLESGAILEMNQSTGQSVVQLAADKGLGVLVNRPLNASFGNHIKRLADVVFHRREDYNTILKKMKAVAKSEARLWRKLLPALDSIPDGLKVRIKQQIGISDTLKHYWRNFGSYERWRQVKNGMMLPRIQGVMDFLQQHNAPDSELGDWMAAHTDCLQKAFNAVGSIYTEDAARHSRTIHQWATAADPDWSGEGTLSQKAIRALRSTQGVTTVLVGMRRETYVEDVLQELRRQLKTRTRVDSWSKLQEQIASANTFL